MRGFVEAVGCVWPECRVVQKRAMEKDVVVQKRVAEDIRTFATKPDFAHLLRKFVEGVMRAIQKNNNNSFQEATFASRKFWSVRPPEEGMR